MTALASPQSPTIATLSSLLVIDGASFPFCQG